MTDHLAVLDRILADHLGVLHDHVPDFEKRELTEETAALRAAIALMRGQSWQDIATAPKDGTEILMTNGEVVHEGHWFNDEGGTVEHRDLDGKWIGQDDSDGFDGWIDWGGGMIPAPTHWQPLPAPPKDSADEQ